MSRDILFPFKYNSDIVSYVSAESGSVQPGPRILMFQLRLLLSIIQVQYLFQLMIRFSERNFQWSAPMKYLYIRRIRYSLDKDQILPQFSLIHDLFHFTIWQIIHTYITLRNLFQIQNIYIHFRGLTYLEVIHSSD